MRQQDVTSEFKNYRQMILGVLEKYPDTRNSDTLLYLQCCEELGAETLDDLRRLNLSIITVHKTRQSIQNKDGLFKANEDIAESRKQRSKEIRNMMKK